MNDDVPLDDEEDETGVRIESRQIKKEDIPSKSGTITMAEPTHVNIDQS